MNAPEKIFLPDVQSTTELRKLAIQGVGVKDVVFPLTVRTARGPQPTVASIDDGVAAYTVGSANFESIHNHSAYARIERARAAA
jgi:GTP cyclohydrolase FolE2